MSEFTAYLHEVFTLFGPVNVRKMFGGYGIYHDGVMFGLVADDTLYLKADADSRDQFLARGLGPFEYEKNGKRVAMSYYLAPEEILEDPKAARAWAKQSWKVAWRARSKRGKLQLRRDS
ncbi:MAG: TfoX/Sxy family protein [Gammaproteobacteria bacterium]|nr:TfoX/Sxy family protein [Gammaproteobacteria bacterium]